MLRKRLDDQETKNLLAFIYQVKSQKWRMESWPYLVMYNCRDVYTTSITLERRRMHVVYTLCAYWVKVSLISYLLLSEKFGYKFSNLFCLPHQTQLSQNKTVPITNKRKRFRSVRDVWSVTYGSQEKNNHWIVIVVKPQDKNASTTLFSFYLTYLGHYCINFTSRHTTPYQFI